MEVSDAIRGLVRNYDYGDDVNEPFYVVKKLSGK